MDRPSAPDRVAQLAAQLDQARLQLWLAPLHAKLWELCTPVAGLRLHVVRTCDSTGPILIGQLRSLTLTDGRVLRDPDLLVDPAPDAQLPYLRDVAGAVATHSRTVALLGELDYRHGTDVQLDLTVGPQGDRADHRRHVDMLLETLVVLVCETHRARAGARQVTVTHTDADRVAVTFDPADTQASAAAEGELEQVGVRMAPRLHAACIDHAGVHCVPRPR